MDNILSWPHDDVTNIVQPVPLVLSLAFPRHANLCFSNARIPGVLSQIQATIDTFP